jgi:hypothetical protein
MKYFDGMPVSRVNDVMQAVPEACSRKIKIFSTAPQSNAVERQCYVKNLIDVARWSEEAGCEGILV